MVLLAAVSSIRRRSKREAATMVEAAVRAATQVAALAAVRAAVQAVALAAMEMALVAEAAQAAAEVATVVMEAAEVEVMAATGGRKCQMQSGSGKCRAAQSGKHFLR